MRSTFLLIGVLLVCLTACEEDSANNNTKSVQEISTENDGPNADIIRNPLTANKPEDTINIAKMIFEETSYNFGKVKEGETVSHIFKFTNTGKVPLIITHAKSTCGCTVPKWPKQPIKPGQGGEILVSFNTKKKKNFQDKPVTITSNTFPSKTVIHIRGHVTPREEN